MPDISSENLSEILFKPRRTSLETSYVSNSVAELPLVATPAKVHFSKWYRQIHFAYWGWLGFDLIEVEAAISRIAACKAERTREHVLDTVYSYGPGNWVYEFSMIADKYTRKAKEFHEALMATNVPEEELRLKDEIFKNYRLADLFFDLASYPHLKGDELATQAMTQHYLYYRKAAEFANGDFAEVKFKVDNKQATMFIHTPDKTKKCPCVVICSNYVNLATEYLRYYQLNLAPLGIALVAVDLPAMGLNVNIPLDGINPAKVHEAAIDYIYEELPYIDSSKIALLGQRIGGNVAVHLLVTKRDKIACAFIVGPTLHEYFTNRDYLDRTPSMLRAVISNRIGVDANQWSDIIPQLQVLSVKRQGILKGIRIDTPIKVLAIKGDFLSPQSDIKLLSGFSSKIEIEDIALGKTIVAFNEIIERSVAFFKKHLVS